jgi:hypothetical protein
MLLSQVFCDHLGAKAASIVSFASESRSRPISSSSERLCAPIDDCDDARLNLLRDLVKPYFCSLIDAALNYLDGRSSTWAVKQIHQRRRAGRLAQARQVKAVLDRRQ